MNGSVIWQKIGNFGKKLDLLSCNHLFEAKSAHCPQGNDLLAGNKEFHGLHSGKRCFILGNGPSLKSQDLKKLQSEYVFTVNFLYKNPQYNDFDSYCHFFMDPCCFIENERPISDLFPINKPQRPKPICFVPASAKNYMEKYNHQELNVRYLYDIGDFDFHLPIRGDITKGISSYYSVTQTAILVAVYMGFSEIILLGCDCTGIVTNMQVMSNQTENIYGYSYKYDASEIQKLKKAYENRIKMEDTVVGWGKIFEGYRRLSDYCTSQNVKLINATHGGVLVTLPRVNYDSLF